MSGSSRDVIQAGNISGGVHFHGPGGPGAPPHTPRQLPADVHAFVNRTDELSQLDAILTGQDGGPLVVSVYVIAGTAGAGKTSLAVHWAHQVRSSFPDGQLYANLRGYDPGEPAAAPHVLRGFLRALGVPAAEAPQDLDDAAALYRSLLAERRMLILLDNAASAGQVRPLLPGGRGSLVVVTSRSRLSGLSVRDGARRLTLGTLPEPEAVALLRTVTSGYRPEEDVDKLTELALLCARLPLALRIAAERAASHPHLRLDDLIADLRDASALWDTLSTGEDEAEAVRTVFAWSYRALSEPAARVFRLLGLHPGPEFGLHAAAALTALPVSRARQLLDDLVGAHLLEQTAPDRYQFHDLLRAYAVDQARREEPAEGQDAALRRAAEWYLHTADAAQRHLRPTEFGLVLAAPAEGVRPLALADYDAAADWAEQEFDNAVLAARAAAVRGDQLLAWRLAAVLWNALPPSASVAAWIPAGQAGREAAEQLGDEKARVLLLTQLGKAHRSMNRIDDALTHLRTALDVSRTTEDRLGQAHAMNLIGLVELRTRALDEAAENFRSAADLFREQGSPLLTATALSNLASSHLHAGRHTEAAAAVEQALAAHRELGSRSEEGNILRLSAELHRELGEVDQARREIEEALEIALALRNRRLEGFWLITLGNVQQAAGQYGDALASYQRSAMLHRRLGDRSREALAWRGAGETYMRKGRQTEGADFHRQAAAVHGELGDSWNRAVDLDRWAAAVIGDNPEMAHGCWHEALTLVSGYGDPRAMALKEQIRERLGATFG